MQLKLKLTDKQKSALVESRNQYLLSIGFHSAGLARLQSQLVVSPTSSFHMTGDILNILIVDCCLRPAGRFFGSASTQKFKCPFR